jgi:hypothetical protein
MGKSVRCTAVVCSGRICRRTVIITNDDDMSGATCYQHKNVNIPKTNKEDVTCPICFDSIKTSGNNNVRLNCKGGKPHCFHKECLKQWFEKDKSTCPMCRDTVPLVTILKIDHMFDTRKKERVYEPLNINVPGYGSMRIARNSYMSDEQILMTIVVAAIGHINNVI